MVVAGRVEELWATVVVVAGRVEELCVTVVDVAGREVVVDVGRIVVDAMTHLSVS